MVEDEDEDEESTADRRRQRPKSAVSYPGSGAPPSSTITPAASSVDHAHLAVLKLTVFSSTTTPPSYTLNASHSIPLRANLKAAASAPAPAVAAVRPGARTGTRVRGCEVATCASAVEYLLWPGTWWCGRLRALRGGDTSRRGQVSAPRPARTLRADEYLTI
jgi:hypothetical protein